MNCFPLMIFIISITTGMYQIDKTVLLGFGLGRQINGSYTIDINGLNPSHIQPLNPLLKKMFSRV